MNEHNIIKRPVITEKSQRLRMESNRYTFEVDPRANKSEIKKAVELLFDVQVEGVQVINYRGKNKRFGMTRGRRNDWKKAYVRLAEGSQIDFLGTE